MNIKQLPMMLMLLAATAVSCNKEDLQNRPENDSTESAIARPRACTDNMDYTADPVPEFVTTKADRKYIIPVVFHVFGEKGIFQDLDKERFEFILQWINNDYHGITNEKDYYNLDRVHADRKEFVGTFDNIEFRLAKFDPDGNPTDGFVKYPSTHIVNKLGPGNRKADAQIARIAWDCEKYMNVYITTILYADGDALQSGVAWLPQLSMTKANTARVVYNVSFLPGNKSWETGTDRNDIDFTSVISHEFGHFMGLKHTFNESDKPCTPSLEDGGSYGDGISDTPQMQNSSNYPAYDHFSSKNCLNEVIDYGNFMNYGKYCNFTKEQIKKMTSYLNGAARRGLWKHENLVQTLGPDYAGTTPAPDPEPANPNAENVKNGNAVVITETDANFPKINAGTRLQIYDANGALIYESSDYDGSFNMSGLAGGTYYYRIQDGTTLYKGTAEVI